MSLIISVAKNDAKRNTVLSSTTSALDGRGDASWSIHQSFVIHIPPILKHRRTHRRHFLTSATSTNPSAESPRPCEMTSRPLWSDSRFGDTVMVPLPSRSVKELIDEKDRPWTQWGRKVVVAVVAVKAVRTTTRVLRWRPRQSMDEQTM